MNPKRITMQIMAAMERGSVSLLFESMADNVTWRWMGTKEWSKTFIGKQAVIDTLFGGAAHTLPDTSSVKVHQIHGDGDSVVVEHSGNNLLADGRRYDNNYCWIFRFENAQIQEVREYMDTQLVTDTFGPPTPSNAGRR